MACPFYQGLNGLHLQPSIPFLGIDRGAQRFTEDHRLWSVSLLFCSLFFWGYRRRDKDVRGSDEPACHSSRELDSLERIPNGLGCVQDGVGHAGRMHPGNDGLATVVAPLAPGLALSHEVASARHVPLGIKPHVATSCPARAQRVFEAGVEGQKFLGPPVVVNVNGADAARRLPLHHPDIALGQLPAIGRVHHVPERHFREVHSLAPLHAQRPCHHQHHCIEQPQQLADDARSFHTFNTFAFQPGIERASGGRPASGPALRSRPGFSPNLRPRSPGTRRAKCASSGGIIGSGKRLSVERKRLSEKVAFHPTAAQKKLYC